jgi:hypothetical protein
MEESNRKFFEAAIDEPCEEIYKAVIDRFLRYQPGKVHDIYIRNRESGVPGNCTE